MRTTYNIFLTTKCIKFFLRYLHLNFFFSDHLSTQFQIKKKKKCAKYANVAIIINSNVFSIYICTRSKNFFFPLLYKSCIQFAKNLYPSSLEKHSVVMRSNIKLYKFFFILTILIPNIYTYRHDSFFFSFLFGFG